VGAGVSGCEDDCEAYGGGGANYFDFDGHILVSGGDVEVVVVVEVADDHEAVICANTAARGFVVHVAKKSTSSVLIRKYRI
jgi:hypothetical protein